MHFQLFLLVFYKQISILDFHSFQSDFCQFKFFFVFQCTLVKKVSILFLKFKLFLLPSNFLICEFKILISLLKSSVCFEIFQFQNSQPLVSHFSISITFLHLLYKLLEFDFSSFNKNVVSLQVVIFMCSDNIFDTLANLFNLIIQFTI